MKKTRYFLILLCFALLVTAINANAITSDDPIEFFQFSSQNNSTKEKIDVATTPYQSNSKTFNKEEYFQVTNDILNFSYSLSTNNIIQVKTVSNAANPLIKEEIFFDNSMILGVDSNKKIVSITKFDKNTPSKITETKNDFKQILEYYDMNPLNYKLTITKEEQYTNYYWERIYHHSIVNPFDSLFISCNTNHTIELLSRFNEQPSNTIIKISQDEAQKNANQILDVSNLNTNVPCELRFIKPNNHWNANGNPDTIRLAYEFTYNDLYIIDIDAYTGANLGGTAMKKGTAAAYAYSGFNYASQSVSKARSAFLSLGYTQADSFAGSTSLIGDLIRTHLASPTAYGLYVDSHGSSTVITDNSTWSINASEITGNWHFVFLDACETAANTTWANAFKINGYSKRAFLGWKTAVTVDNAYKFCCYFWPEVVSQDHSNYVEEAARWAAAQVPGSGTTPIRFYGDKYYNGREY